MKFLNYDDILTALPPVSDLMDAMKIAFIQYSAGRAWVAPVSHVVVEGNGDACIKAGYLKGEASWVVKVAGGFPGNSALGLSNSQGVMLLFSQQTGALQCILADNGYLTDVRTAAAAVLCIRELKSITARTLAVYGTGVIGKLVIEYAATLFCGSSEVELLVVSRCARKAQEICELATSKLGWAGQRVASASASEAARRADVIVTCTPSTKPLIHEAKGGALIVALGADAPGKRELGGGVFGGSSAPTSLRSTSPSASESHTESSSDVLLLVDSAAQCLKFGEAAHRPADIAITELGQFFSNPKASRGVDQTVVVDLTGVAVQDVAIAAAVSAYDGTSGSS